MYLRDLLSFDQVVVQCHDLPDADSIAAAYALYAFFRNNHKNVKIVYSGDVQISRDNIKLMIDELKIPLEHVASSFKCDELLITVGCKYGDDNVTKLDAKEIAIIDNHSGYAPSSIKVAHIKSAYGSCSSLVYQMLLAEFAANNQKEVVDSLLKDLYVTTALRYGVYIATNAFSEIVYSADQDICEELVYDEEIFNHLQYSTLSIDELKIVGNALNNIKINEELRFAVGFVDQCDASIISYIADIICRVHSIDSCVVYADLGYFYKLSIRSSSREIKAKELVEFLVDQVGYGGHKDHKAGGLIFKERYQKHYGNKELTQYLHDRYKEFKTSYDCIYAEKFDFVAMQDQFKKYMKKQIIQGYVKTTDLIEVGSKLILKTCEGNVEITSDPNIYVMIGIKGEVYAIEKDKFDLSYKDYEGSYEPNYEYEPRVYNSVTKTSRLLKPYIRPCRTLSRLPVWGKPLTKATKLFTKSWDYENYMFGLEGDMLMVRIEDRKDLYIAKREIFELTYEPVEEPKLPPFMKK